MKVDAFFREVGVTLCTASPPRVSFFSFSAQDSTTDARVEWSRLSTEVLGNQTRETRRGYGHSARLFGRVSGNPYNSIGNENGIHEGGYTGPPVGIVVPEGDDSRVLGLVSIHHGVLVIDSENPSQGFDLIIVAGEMVPARPRSIEGLAVSGQHFRLIYVGVDTDRKKEYVLADPFSEMLVNLHEVRGDARSYAITDGIKELDDHDPVANQVAVEPVFFSLMVGEDDIREFV